MPIDDYDSSLATTGVVSVNGFAAGSIEAAGDTDWFAVNLVGGHSYSFGLQGSASHDGTLVDPCLWLLNGSGAQLAYNDDISSANWNSLITYTAPSSGVYYLSAGSRGGPGTYRINASEIDGGSTAATATSLSIGNSLTGSIEVRDDTDWFAVNLVRGASYQFDLQGGPSGNGTLVDPCLQLLDASGAQLAYNDDIGSSNWDSRITYTATESGTFYLSAASRGGPGTYRVAATRTDDYASTSSLAGALAIGGAIAGEIEAAGDNDWFAVNLVAGVHYQFDLQGNPSGNGTLVDPCLTLRDSLGTPLAYNDDIGSTNWDSQISFTPTSSETCYLSVASRGGPGTYRLSARSDDFGSTPQLAGALAVGNTISGAIEAAGNTDWFAVTLDYNHTYQFDLQGSSSGGGSLVDPCLWLLSDSGHSICYSDDISSDNWDSRINTGNWSLHGTYYLSVGSRGGPGTYRLSMVDVKDDFAASTSTTGVVGIGSSTTGNIETANDADWFAVSLLAGKTYDFYLQGTPSAQGSLEDPCLWLLSSSGTTLAANDDIAIGNPDSHITYTATSDGTYYLSATSHSGPGRYRITATVTGSDDYAASISTTGAVTMGSSVSGSIETAGDIDWFAVNLVAGQPYQFALKGASSGNGTLSDPCLWLLDGSGATLAYNDDFKNLDSNICFAAPSSGTYYLAAGSRGGTGNYHLSAANPNAFGSIAQLEGTLSTGSSVIGNLDTPSDTDWRAVTLTAGHTYEFYLGGYWSQGQAELTDPCLWLLDGSGKALAYNDDARWSASRIDYTATADGTYYLSAGSRADAGMYQLWAFDETVPPDDHGTTPETAGSLTLGRAVIGQIEVNGDTDWFAFSVQAGHSYYFTLDAFDPAGSPPDTSSIDPYLKLLDSSGHLLMANDDLGSSYYNSLIRWTPTSDGTVYLVASAAGPAGTGGYKVLATEALPVGHSVSGDIQTTGEIDRFMVTLLGGQTYHFDLQGSPSGHGTLSDPCLWLRNPYGWSVDGYGHSVAYSDDISSSNWDSHIAFTPTWDGTYSLDVGGRGVTGTYLLSVGAGP